MEPTKIVEDVTLITIFLIESGCCKRCCLRFINRKISWTSFDEPEESLMLVLNGNVETVQQTFKKIKPSPCIICLDLLHTDTIEKMVAYSELEKLKEYDCETIHPFITYPTSVYIREHRILLSIKDKFPEFFKEIDVMPLNKAWSLTIKKKLTDKIKKKYVNFSKLHVHFTTSHEHDKEECASLYKIRNSSKTKGLNDVSRKYLADHIKDIEDDIFKSNVTLQIPTIPLAIEGVTFWHDFIFVAGRYCKYSRFLSQSPWSEADVYPSICKTSVQEIIFEPIQKIFNCQSLVFSSSGREDIDVRTLGKGRPFYVKILDPKVTKVTFDSFRSIEKNIKESKLVKVRDLQLADKSCIEHIKKGEEAKKKTYKAVCIVDKPENLSLYIDKINSIGSVEMEQLTPVRVIHRRTRQTRAKNIYYINAKTIQERKNMFELNLVTQAGTYVKEFVHGDLCRSKPSLRDLIGGFVDLVALDVMKVDLDYPPYINPKVK